MRSVTTRRTLLGGLFAGLGVARAAIAPGEAFAADAVSLRGDAARADDEPYWEAVARSHYAVNREVTPLENGNFGVMALSVARAHARHLERVNANGAWYSRRQAEGDAARVLARAAGLLGVDAAELVLTRGATESLLGLIGGYGRLRPGDAVLYADHDYDSMQSAMRWLAQRRGVTVRRLELPEPATHQGLIDAYAAALRDTPSIRLVLLTHVGHRSGLVLPIAEIAALARRHGADTILDTAHGWGQVPLDLRAMGIDFAGLTCHKWLGAPLGVGLMYVRRERISDIEPYMGSDDFPHAADLRDRIHTGTRDLAGVLALEDALDFHLALGPGAKMARLACLRDRWVEPLRNMPHIELLTPADPRLYGGITSFRLRGATSVVQNRLLARRLLEEHDLFTVYRQGLAGGACVRVTPAVSTLATEVDRLREVLQSWRR